MGQPHPPARLGPLHAGARDRPVVLADSELEVPVGPGRDREGNLADQFIRLQGGGEEMLKEVSSRDPAAVGDDRGVEHHGQGRVVAGRVRMGHHPAQGAPGTDLGVADLSGHLGEQR